MAEEKTMMEQLNEDNILSDNVKTLESEAITRRLWGLGEDSLCMPLQVPKKNAEKEEYSTRYITRLPSGHISRVEILVDKFGKLIKARDV